MERLPQCLPFLHKCVQGDSITTLVLSRYFQGEEGDAGASGSKTPASRLFVVLKYGSQCICCLCPAALCQLPRLFSFCRHDETMLKATKMIEDGKRVRTYQRLLKWTDRRLRLWPEDCSRSELSARERPRQQLAQAVPDRVSLRSVSQFGGLRESSPSVPGFVILPERDHSTTAIVFSRSVFSHLRGFVLEQC